MKNEGYLTNLEKVRKRNQLGIFSTTTTTNIEQNKNHSFVNWLSFLILSTMLKRILINYRTNGKPND